MCPDSQNICMQLLCVLRKGKIAIKRIIFSKSTFFVKLQFFVACPSWDWIFGFGLSSNIQNMIFWYLPLISNAEYANFLSKVEKIGQFLSNDFGQNCIAFSGKSRGRSVMPPTLKGIFICVEYMVKRNHNDSQGLGSYFSSKIPCFITYAGGNHCPKYIFWSKTPKSWSIRPQMIFTT